MIVKAFNDVLRISFGKRKENEEKSEPLEQHITELRINNKIKAGFEIDYWLNFIMISREFSKWDLSLIFSLFFLRQKRNSKEISLAN